LAETRLLLQGQVALVTGAGRGLGRAFAERLAGLGCAVGVHGMREHGPAEYGEGTTLTATAEAIGRDHGVRSCRVLGDLTQEADVARVVGVVGELSHVVGSEFGFVGDRPVCRGGHDEVRLDVGNVPKEL
jgi:3-oxoacyl-[acyl-carrier protein] reductase